mgnify:CR=1 FL=1
MQNACAGSGKERTRRCLGRRVGFQGPGKALRRKEDRRMHILAVVVNYRSRPWTCRAVHSLCANSCSASLEVVVVDNSEDAQEWAALKKALPASVSLMRFDRNVGFGQACQRVWETHRHAEGVLLLNPDATLCAGCLPRLTSMLQARPDVGAVAPRIYWDPEKRFCCPPAWPAEWVAAHTMAGQLGVMSPWAYEILARLWRLKALHFWTAARPQSVAAVSGDVVLVRSEAAAQVGGLFDPRFFLYYEDTDLSHRLRRAGWRLMMDPGAEAVHEYDQCARADLGFKRQWMHVSHLGFLDKHYPRLGRLVRRVPAHPPGTFRLAKSVVFRAPFCVRVPRSLRSRWLFEWSPNPHGMPAAGQLGSGDQVIFDASCWNRLAPGRYVGRLGPAQGLGAARLCWAWEVS